MEAEPHQIGKGTVWIRCLHIARADVLIAIQHLFERLATIDGSINTAFFVRPVRMTGYGYKDAVRIFWIDRQLRDLLTFAQSEMRPRFAGISRFINAITD